MPTYYKRNVNPTNNNWNQADNWSTVNSTSAVNSSGTFPSSTTADPVVFDANSTNVNVNVASVCTSITFVGYTNFITMTSNLTVHGAVTFGASMNVTVAGGALIMVVSATLTSNGYAWPGEFRFNGTARTYTLAQDTTFNGLLTTSGAVTSVTIGGAFNITCAGGCVAPVTIASSSVITINMTGGNLSGGFSTVNLVLLSGTITQTGTIAKSAASFIYTAGTFNSGGNSLTLGGTVTVSLGSNVVFGAATFNASGTFTFNDDIWIAGMLTLPGFGYASTYVSSLNKIIYCWGMSGSSNQNEPFGTSATRPQIVFNGTGNWSYQGNLNLNVTISTLGTLTITGTKNLGSTSYSANLTYITAGAIIYSSALLNSIGNNTIDCSGMTWPNIQIGSLNRTITLLSDLNCSGTLTFAGASITIACNGLFNINTNSLNVTGASMNINGTANIVLNPSVSGTWSHTNQPASFNIPVVINAVGTLTMSGTINKNGNLTYTAGTIVSTGSILNWLGTMTINAPGFNLATLNLLGNSQFFGTNGFTMANLNCTTVGLVSLWKPTNEYIITTAFGSGQADGVSKITYTSTNNVLGTATFSGTQMSVSAVTYGVISVGDTIFAEGIGTGVYITSFGTGSGGAGTYNLSSSVGILTVGRLTITSPNIASYPKITLQNGATQSLFYTNAIDVDSNNGQTIWSFSGKLLRAANWGLLTTPVAHVETWAT